MAFIATILIALAVFIKVSGDKAHQLDYDHYVFETSIPKVIDGNEVKQVFPTCISFKRDEYTLEEVTSMYFKSHKLDNSKEVTLTQRSQRCNLDFPLNQVVTYD